VTVDLQQTAIDVDPTSIGYSGDEYVAMLEDTQGNILQSHGRDFSTLLALTFETSNVAAVRSWIAQVVAPTVTPALNHHNAIMAHREGGADGGLFVNFGLSADGYRSLGIADVPDDPSFLRGAKSPDGHAPLPLNDPPVSSWNPGLQGTLHALLLLADDNQQTLGAAVDQATRKLSRIATVAAEEHGETLRNDRGEPIEHFGFADGVSQPLFMAPDIERARLNGGLDRYDPSAPLGLALLKDPGGGPSGYGTYFVFRKLSQDVTNFLKQEQELQAELGPDADPGLAGAYVVGRFRDGTPVVAQPVPGWLNEPLNFDYDGDADGMRCPFGAHIRKANPRSDKLREFGIPPEEARSRRIARRAVPYPPGATAGQPPAGTDVGLLFACVQSSIVHQFEFIQSTWSNFTEFLRPGTGLDAVIGQAPTEAPGVPQPFPKVWGDRARPDSTITVDFTPCVTMKGGEYYFLPSLSFLAGLANS
jgi:Dyp-type peroxidase family